MDFNIESLSCKSLAECIVLGHLGLGSSGASLRTIVKWDGDVDNGHFVTLYDGDVRSLPWVWVTRNMLILVDVTMTYGFHQTLLDHIVTAADGDHVQPAVVQDMWQRLQLVVTPAALGVGIPLPSASCTVGWEAVQAGAVDKAPVTEANEASRSHPC